MKDSATGAWCALWSGVKVSGWTPAALLIVMCAVPIVHGCLSESGPVLELCSIFEAGDAGRLCAKATMMRGGGLP